MKGETQLKNLKKLTGYLAVFVLLALVFVPMVQRAGAVDPDNIISYQGRLLDSNGVPLAAANADMQFRFYDAAVGGSCLWSNDDSGCATNADINITLTDGLFSENLGDTGDGYAAVNDTVFADNDEVYLEVEVEGETLTPRKRVVATPYALNAQTLDGIDSGSFMLNTGDVATGDFDFSGAEFISATPLVFEGPSNDGVTTSFQFIDPTGANTITFQDGTGTVAFLSDITGGLWEDGANGVFEDDEAVIVGVDAAFVYASGGVGDLRVADEIEVLSDAYIANDLVVGASTSDTSTMANGGFALGGDDLFVAGMAGVEGNVYTDGRFIAGASSEYGDGLITDSGGDFTFTLNAAGDDLFIQTGNVKIGDAAPTVALDGEDLYVEGNIETDGNLYLIASTSLYLDADTTAGESTAATDSGAYLIGVFDEFTNSNSTNVQDVLDDLDSAIAGGGANTLDAAYDQGGAGVGRSITVDAGALQFAGSNAADETLEISQSTDFDLVTVLASNTGFSNTILNMSTNEEDTGNFYFMELYSDADGVPDREFYIDQNGNVAADGRFAAGGATTYYDDGSLYTSAATSGFDIDVSAAAGSVDVILNGGNAGDDFTVDGSVLVVESDNDQVGVGTATPGAKLEVEQGAASVGLLIDQNGEGSALSLDTTAVTSDSLSISSNSTTTGNVIEISATSLTSGDMINLTRSGVSNNGGFISMNDGTDETIIFNYGGSPNGALTAPRGSIALDYTNGRIYINTDDANTWSQLGVAGAGNTLDLAYDQGGAGAGRQVTVDSSAIEFTGSNAADYTFEVTTNAAGGALYVNDTNGTGLALHVDNGDVQFDDDVNLGDALTDALTVTGAIQGASALYFDGATDDGWETIFVMPDPVGSDNSITFQDGTGTVAFLSDIGSSLWTDGTNGYFSNTEAIIVGADAAFSYGSGAAGDLKVDDELEVLGDVYLGNTSGDTVTSNAAAWTFANDTAVTLSGGVNGLNFDSNTLSIDATNDRVGIGTASPLATLDVRGAATFNEAGIDADFRIESDGNANMFFVDGGDNEVGIGTNTPVSFFHISSTDTGDVMTLSANSVTNGNAFTANLADLTGGNGIYLYRVDDADLFTGHMIHINQTNDNTGSTGDGLLSTMLGAGDAIEGTKTTPLTSGTSRSIIGTHNDTQTLTAATYIQGTVGVSNFSGDTDDNYTELQGTRGEANFTGTAGTAEERIYGSAGYALMDVGAQTVNYTAGAFGRSSAGNGTISNAYGLYGEVYPYGTGAITTAYGVYGYVREVTDAMTTGYGGYFRADDATTTIGIAAVIENTDQPMIRLTNNGAAETADIFVGAADPPIASADDGSLYLLDTGSEGELWLRTGGAWSEIALVSDITTGYWTEDGGSDYLYPANEPNRGLMIDPSGSTINGTNPNTYINLGWNSTIGTAATATDYLTISGGAYNRATEDYASVGGGYGNYAQDQYTTVAGGDTNQANEMHGTIGGGDNNIIDAGSSVTSASRWATIGGGDDNLIDAQGGAFQPGGQYSTIGGGNNNNITGTGGWAGRNGVIVGGADNTISAGISSAIGGGEDNTIDTTGSNFATIVGGYNNTVSAEFSTVAGGSYNTVVGRNSWVAGRSLNLDSSADQTFAFGYDSSSSSDIDISQANAFLVFPVEGIDGEYGEMGIGTATPGAKIDIVNPSGDAMPGIEINQANTAEPHLALLGISAEPSSLTEGDFWYETGASSDNPDSLCFRDSLGVVCVSSSSTTNYWQQSGTDLSPATSGDDILLGATETLTLNTSTNLFLDSDTSAGESTSATDSGAYLIGVFDEFDNSSASNVQDVLDDLDAAITGGATGDITSVGSCLTGDCFDGTDTNSTSLSFYDSDSHFGALQTVNLDGARTYSLPNQSGTIALTSDALWLDGTNGYFSNTEAIIVGADAAFSYGSGAAGDLKVDDELEVLGDVYLGNTSGDTVTSNAAAWTFANDTAVTLSGGVNGLNFDSNTLSIDATNDRVGIGTASPLATLDVRGAATFNEAGIDADFRIESDGNANMFFVDGGDNEVGIGTNTPVSFFHISSTDTGDVMTLSANSVTNGNAFTANLADLTGGNGIYLYRVDDADLFTGHMIHINQTNDNTGSTGDGLLSTMLGAGDAIEGTKTTPLTSGTSRSIIGTHNDTQTLTAATYIQGTVGVSNFSGDTDDNYTELQGTRGEANFTGTAGTAEERIYGSAGYALMDVGAQTVNYTAGAFGRSSAGNGTISNAYGLYGEVYPYGTGAITTAYGVYGYVREVTDAMTTGYGGYFRADDATTTIGIAAVIENTDQPMIRLTNNGAAETADIFVGAADPPIASADDGSLYLLDTGSEGELWLRTGGAWSEIALVSDVTASGVTLDGAYDYGGAGAGRQVTVDSSAIEFTGSNAADYTFEVTTNAAGGALYVNDTNGTGLALHVDNGDVQFDDNATLGSSDTDDIDVNGEFISNLIPNADDTYTLGDADQRWADIFLGSESIHIGTATADEYIIGYDTGNNALVYNEAGDDFDVRIEGDNIGDLFYVDAGDDRVAIGTNAAGARLDVLADLAEIAFRVNTQATSTANAVLIGNPGSGDAVLINNTGSGEGIDLDMTDPNNDADGITVTHASNGTGDGITVSLTDNSNNGSGVAITHAGPGDALSITKNIAGNGIDLDMAANSPVDAFGISVDVTNAGAGSAMAADFQGSNVQIWDGAASVDFATGEGDLYVEDDLEVDGAIYGTLNPGLTDGSIVFINSGLSEDNANFFYNNATKEFYLGGTSAANADINLAGTGAAIFNEGGGSVDFRVESNNETNMLFVDGSADMVGIGASSPSAILDVANDPSGGATAIVMQEIDLDILNSNQTANTTGLDINFADGVNSSTATNTGLNIDLSNISGGTDYGMTVAANDYAAVFTIGNVGIGDTTPDADLDILSNAAGESLLNLEALASVNQDVIHLENSGSGTGFRLSNQSSSNAYGIYLSQAANQHSILVQSDSTTQSILDGNSKNSSGSLILLTNEPDAAGSGAHGLNVNFVDTNNQSGNPIFITPSANATVGQIHLGTGQNSASAANESEIWYDDNDDQFCFDNGTEFCIDDTVASGTGSTGQVTFWTASGLSGENNFFWDASNDELGIGTNAPDYDLEVAGDAGFIDTTNENVVTVHGDNAAFSNTLLTLQTDEEDTGSFYFIEAIEDFDNTGDVKFSVDQDGTIVSGSTITINGSSNFIESSGNMQLRPNGETDDYVEFSSTGSHLELVTVGGGDLRLDPGSDTVRNYGMFGIYDPASEVDHVAISHDGTNALVTYINTGAMIFNDNASAVDFQIKSTANDNMFFVDAVDDRVGVGTNNPSTELEVAGDIGVDERLEHNLDTNTYLSFTNNQIDFFAGAVSMLSLDEGTQDIVVVNNTGADVDFQVQATGAANALFVRGSDGNVGLGTSAPGQILDVAGNVELDEYLYFNNAGTESLRWNNGASQFELSDDVNLSGHLAAGTAGAISTNTVVDVSETLNADSDFTGLDLDATLTGAQTAARTLYGTSSTLDFTGTTASTIDMSAIQAVADYSSASDSAALSYLRAIKAEATLSNTGNVDYIYGLEIDTDLSAAGSVANVYGINADIANTAGTISSGAYGAYLRLSDTGAGTNQGLSTFVNVASATNYGNRNVVSGTGSTNYGVHSSVGGSNATNNYAVYATATGSGTTPNYGVYTTASGGANNYAIYSEDGNVQIHDGGGGTANVATGDGDLYVQGQLELDLDNAGASDGVTITGTDVTTGDVMDIGTNSLTSGSGIKVTRVDSGSSNYTAGSSNALLYLAQLDDEVGSVGEVVRIKNSGGGSGGGDATALHIYQDFVDNPGVNSMGQQALVIDVGQSGSAEDVIKVRNDAAAETILRFTNQGKMMFAGTLHAGQVSNTYAYHTISSGAVTKTLAAVAGSDDLFIAGDVELGSSILCIDDDGTDPDTCADIGAPAVGNAYADGSFNSAAFDVAERMPSTDATLSAGEVVVLDSANAEHVLRSSGLTYEPGLVGVVSTDPAFVMGWDTSPPIALSGRVPVRVSDENGLIEIGDYLTTSSTPGYAMKATEAGMVLGRAMQIADPGNDIIVAFVDVEYYTGAVLGTDGTDTVITDNLVIDNASLTVRGSGGTSAAVITAEGDVQLAGRLYPSDRGDLQTDKYIYYDGSEGWGGDMMRTNASGWSTGSYDFAEMFPSDEVLEAGDVVVFDTSDEKVRRSSESYDGLVAGIVSTKPGFLAGDSIEGDYPVALAGRVPVKVSLENGPIAVGDPLTTSSTPGYAMKATEAGPIVGNALENYNGDGGDSIIAFVNVGYWGGGVSDTTPGTENIASGFGGIGSNVGSLTLGGSLYMQANDIINVNKIAGLGDWEVSPEGDFKTKGSFMAVIETYQGEEVEVQAELSLEATVTMSGTAQLSSGQVTIEFEEIDPHFNDIISTIAPVRVMAMPIGEPVQLYVNEQNNDGFTIMADSSSDTEFNWFVTAYRKDMEPEKYLNPETEEIIEPEEESIEEETTEEESEEDTEVDAGINDIDPIAEEPADDGETVEDPDQSGGVDEIDQVAPNAGDETNSSDNTSDPLSETLE